MTSTKAKILYTANVLSIKDRNKTHDIYIKDEEVEEVIKLLLRKVKRK